MCRWGAEVSPSCVCAREAAVHHTTCQFFKGCGNISSIQITLLWGPKQCCPWHWSCPEIPENPYGSNPPWITASHDPREQKQFRETPPRLKCKSTCWVMKAPVGHRPRGWECNWGGADCPWQGFLACDRKAAENYME